MENVYASGAMQGGIADALSGHPYWHLFLIATLCIAAVACLMRCSGLIKSCPLWPMPFLKGPSSSRQPRSEPD